jgi:hypothetical protein
VRKARKPISQFLNLDSLVDIVSNNVGILIILAAFMALFALLNPQDPTRTESRLPREEPPPRILVPWSHPTNKNPLYFTVRENRVQFLDLRPFFLELASRSPSEQPGPLTVEQKGVKIRFYPVTNQVFCLQFLPAPHAGESWFQARKAGSAWQDVLRRYPPEKYLYFFWVTGDSFELFRQVRRSLWDRQIEVGWKPALKDAPLEVCNGFEGSTAFQPQ